MIRSIVRIFIIIEISKTEYFDFVKENKNISNEKIKIQLSLVKEIHNEENKGKT